MLFGGKSSLICVVAHYVAHIVGDVCGIGWLHLLANEMGAMEGSSYAIESGDKCLVNDHYP